MWTGAVDRPAQQMAGRFAGTFAPETIERCLHDSYDTLAATSKVTNFLLALAERFARERLTALAKLQGAIVSDRPEILFVCVHNAGRSIAAAVLTEHYGQGRVRVRSAGSAPGSEVNPAVAEALRERGLDPDQQFPKPLTDETARAADVIVTMGCGDACPRLPRQAAPRLAAHRPRREVARPSATDRRRHRQPRPGAAGRGARRGCHLDGCGLWARTIAALA